MILRLFLPLAALLATPSFADPGLHHHPHGVEFGWLTVALIGSVVGGAVVYAVQRLRK
jgi:hypothetical protein